MRDAVAKLWPEIEWIEDKKLRGQVAETWVKALERSPLKPDDLNRIPFTLLVANCPITFMEHKRCVVHIARQSAEAMQQFMGRALPIDKDTVIAGAILADVGKLLEYELGADGKSRQSERGEALRHPFTGVALALECGVPDAVCHIIAAHAAEGDLVKRTTGQPSVAFPPTPLCFLPPHIRLHQHHHLAHRPSLLQIPDRILQLLLRSIRQDSLRQCRKLLLNLGI